MMAMLRILSIERRSYGGAEGALNMTLRVSHVKYARALSGGKSRKIMPLRQTEPHRSCATARSGFLTANSIVAVMPAFVVMVPFPVSWSPDVINSAVPVPRPVNIVRPIADPDRDVDCVHRWNRYAS